MPSVSPTKLVFIEFQSSFELGVAIAVNETYQKFADPHVKLKIEEAIAATMDGITAAHVSVVRVCAVPPGCASRRQRLLRREIVVVDRLPLERHPTRLPAPAKSPVVWRRP